MPSELKAPRAIFYVPKTFVIGTTGQKGGTP